MISMALHILLGSGLKIFFFFVKKGIWSYKDIFIGWLYQHSRTVTSEVAIANGIASLYVCY